MLLMCKSKKLINKSTHWRHYLHILSDVGKKYAQRFATFVQENKRTSSVMIIETGKIERGDSN